MRGVLCLAWAFFGCAACESVAPVVPLDAGASDAAGRPVPGLVRALCVDPTEPLPIVGRTVFGDFDGDGRGDLAMAGLDIALGHAGGYRAPVPSGVGGTPFVAIDLDATGGIDLIASEGARLHTLLSNRDGTMREIASYDIASLCVPSMPHLGPGIVAQLAADFTGDGANDLLIVCRNPTALVLLPGDGTGRLGAAVVTPLDRYASAVTTARLDGDDAMDLVLAGPAVDGVGIGAVTMFEGGPSGMFLPSSTPGGSLPASPSAIVAGRFDGDAAIDYVAADGARVYFHMSSGGDRDTGLPASALLAADVDGDGHSDLVGAGDAIWVERGNGDGTFAPPAYYLGASVPSLLAARDQDLDGRIDLTVGDTGAGLRSYAYLHRGIGAAEFDGERLVPIANGLSNAPQPMQWVIAIADLNRDGRADFLLGGGYRLSTLLSSPTGYEPRDAVGDAPGGRRAAVADLNGDGILDVVTVSGGMSTYLGEVGGGLTLANQSDFGNLLASGVAIGDVDRDGNLDAVVATSAAIGLLRGDGHGRFSAPTFSSFAAFDTLVLGDIDGDGRVDVVGAAPGGGVLVAPGIAGGFAPALLYDTAGQVTDVAVCDLDGDGADEIIAATGTGDPLVSSGFSTGPVSWRTPIPVGNLATALACADVDADGHLDVVAGGQDSVVISPGRGDLSFRPPVVRGTRSPSRVWVADFDGDHSVDVGLDHATAYDAFVGYLPRPCR